MIWVLIILLNGRFTQIEFESLEECKAGESAIRKSVLPYELDKTLCLGKTKVK